MSHGKLIEILFSGCDFLSVTENGIIFYKHNKEYHELEIICPTDIPL